jgi:hypothetical protein
LGGVAADEVGHLLLSAPASTTYARASAAVALLQRWLCGFALPIGLETFAALQALSENASCKFTPAVRTVSLVFFGKYQPRKTRTKSLNLKERLQASVPPRARP